MIVFILFLLFIGIVVILSKSGETGESNNVYHGSYVRDCDNDFDDDYDDYSDSETKAARGNRDYFSDDPAEDYNSYYAQVSDDAMMGDKESIDEIYGEFGVEDL